MEDEDFEVTAEMLIHDDVDDESTLDEEEALLEEDEEEIAKLQKESEMPLEELLAMYGYGAPPSEEEESEDEGEGEEESEESSSETDPTSAAPTGQTSHTRAGPSTSLSTSSHVGTLSRSKRKSSSSARTTDVKPINVDPPSPPVPQPLELVHEDVVNHNLVEAEVEIGGNSPTTGKSSLLGKHYRSDVLGSSDDALYRDVMLSSRTDEHLVPTSSDHTHSTSVPSDHLSPYLTHPSTIVTIPSATTHTAVTTSHSQPSTSSAHSQPSSSGAGPSSSAHPERRSLRLMTAGERLAFEGYFSALFEDENSDESDDEYIPRDLHWRKEIKVGSNYQAKLPEVRTRSSHSSAAPSFPASSSSSSSNANSSNHHDNGNSHLLGELVWNPKETTEEKVVKFLESISEEVSGMDSSGERDNEQALEVLQKCNHNVPKALEYIHKKGLSAGMKPWSEEECRNFEEGLQSLGKDFFNIQCKIPTRTVKEVVEFYYIWKKTERYDAFVQQYGKIGRKKIVYPPGFMSDFMERYLDLFATDAPELQYATTSVYAEMKRDNL